jgi:predicted RNA-binding protein YlqC (UPF0109 family)
LKDILEYLIKSIISKPSSQLCISEETINGYLTLIIEADENEKPMLIGRNGKTIKALYNLLYPVAKRERIYSFQLKVKD